MAHRKKQICSPSMSFADCELAIMRMAVDKNQEKRGKRMVESRETRKLMAIVEQFLKTNARICYGGTAINALMPPEDQFYNRDSELPDYDFYSPTAMEDAKALADIYHKEGFDEVEAKAGVHLGTYKVFVNFIPVADITFLSTEIYDALHKDSVVVDEIHFASPNFLRMAMYLELSRPMGDTDRWEKVLKRLTLLNQYYPITEQSCSRIPFQRSMETHISQQSDIFHALHHIFIKRKAVFFGGYAMSLYAKYMPSSRRLQTQALADFDVLVHAPREVAKEIQETLSDRWNLSVVEHEAVGEIVPMHIEIKYDAETVAFLYEPIACHSYNVLTLPKPENKIKVRVATIDTMLSFYLAFLYTQRPYYNAFLARTLCMAKFLFDVQQHNRLRQTGLLRRFHNQCIGYQPTKEDLRKEKSKMRKRFTRKHREFEAWFLNYRPGQPRKRGSTHKQQTQKHKQHIWSPILWNNALGF